MVDYVDSSELTMRLRMYAFGSTPPAEIADRLRTIPGVDADVICDAAEILYAHVDLLDNGGKKLTAELFNHADQQRWTTFNRDGRSKTIVSLLAREMGETGPSVAKASVKWPKPEVNRRNGEDWRPEDDREAEDPA